MSVHSVQIIRFYSDSYIGGFPLSSRRFSSCASDTASAVPRADRRSGRRAYCATKLCLKGVTVLSLKGLRKREEPGAEAAV